MLAAASRVNKGRFSFTLCLQLHSLPSPQPAPSGNSFHTSPRGSWEVSAGQHLVISSSPVILVCALLSCTPTQPSPAPSLLLWCFPEVSQHSSPLPELQLLGQLFLMEGNGMRWLMFRQQNIKGIFVQQQDDQDTF